MIERLKIRVLPDGRVSRADAALFLGYTAKTLAEWHTKGLGPPAHKVGGRRFYYLSDLEAFRDGTARAA